MTALVPELVNMASDPAVTTTQLLRRALVIANRLGVPEIVSWIDSELNGYKGEVPAYRIIHGELKVHNPYHGLIPLRMNSSKQMQWLTEHDDRQSIPELENMLEKKGSGIFLLTFPPEVERRLMQGMEIPLQPQLQFTRTQVSGIVEKARNRILEWALDLETRGILGEGMTFTQREKQTVQEQHYHFGDVTGSQIQIGSNSSSQHQANRTAGDIDGLKSVVEGFIASIQQSGVSGELVDELRAELATLRAQAASPKPKWEIVKVTAQSVKAIVEGAAGSVLGELAKPHIQALLGLLPS